MAGEGRSWLQKHGHETNVVTYGTVGTASYLENQHEWLFLKHGHYSLPISDEDQTRDESSTGFRFLGELETVVQPTSTTALTKPTLPIQSLPELSAASVTIKETAQDVSSIILAPTGHCIAFGSAAWLGSDGFDSGNLTVPVTAFVSGIGLDNFQIACLGKRTHQYCPPSGIRSDLSVPSLNGYPRVNWTGSESIRQLSFSERDSAGHHGTFLAVRQSSMTCIFEPLLLRHSPLTSSNVSSLDPNMILRLSSEFTGGVTHADIAFDPENQRRFAIVDVEGNWSIWVIRGKRSATIRSLYQVQLKVSGKIFSWEREKRPNGIHAYFDGWHRVFWVSCSGKEIDRLVVCNRKSVAVFDLQGDQICSLDARLDNRNPFSWILDVQRGPAPNLYMILTTTKILLFDFTQQDWKIPLTNGVPVLLCAWEHHQSPNDLTQKIFALSYPESILLMLYNSRSALVKTYKVYIRSTPEGILVHSADGVVTKLPNEFPEIQILSLILAKIQTSGLRPSGGQQPRVAKLVVQHKNLAVVTLDIVISLSSSTKPKEGVMQSFDIKLPPNRNIRSRSERYVDSLDDEYDLAGFLTSDPDSNGSEQDRLKALANYDHGKLAKSRGSAIDLSGVLNHLGADETSSRKPLLSIQQALEDFERILEEAFIAREGDKMRLLSEYFCESTWVQELEMDSALLDQRVDVIAQETGFDILSLESDELHSLSQVHQMIFESYVESLGSHVPDRVRVHRERLARKISLDRYLSSRAIQRQIPSQAPGANLISVTDSDPLILSDPVENQDIYFDNQVLPTFPASQPQSKSTKGLQPAVHRHEPALSTLSPIPDCLARLSAFTTFSQSSSQDILHDHQASHHITSLLAHLPEDANSSPDQYDYQAIELALAVERVGHLDEPGNNAVQHKSRKLENAKRRAEARTGALRIPQIQAIEQLQQKDLPIRNSAGPAAVPWRGAASTTRHSESQPELRLAYSDGLTAGEGSSQQQGNSGGMTSTQPERGVFANRLNESKGQAKKKKKRTAGF